MFKNRVDYVLCCFWNFYPCLLLYYFLFEIFSFCFKKMESREGARCLIAREWRFHAFLAKWPTPDSATVWYRHIALRSLMKQIYSSTFLKISHFRWPRPSQCFSSSSETDLLCSLDRQYWKVHGNKVAVIQIAYTFVKLRWMNHFIFTTMLIY